MTNRIWNGGNQQGLPLVGQSYFADASWLDGAPVAGDTAIVDGTAGSVPFRLDPILGVISTQDEATPIAFFDTGLINALEGDPAASAVPMATPVAGETMDLYGGQALVQAILVNSTFSSSTSVHVTGNARFDNDYTNTLAGTIVVEPTTGDPVNDAGANGELDLVEHSGGSSDPTTLAPTGYVPTTTNTGLILVGPGSRLVVDVQGNPSGGANGGGVVPPAGYTDGGIATVDGFAAFTNTGGIGVSDGQLVIDAPYSNLGSQYNHFMNNGLIALSGSALGATLDATGAAIDGTGSISLKGSGAAKVTANFGGYVTNAVSLADGSASFFTTSSVQPTTNIYAGGSFAFLDNAGTLSVDGAVLGAGFLPVSGFSPGDQIVVPSYEFATDPFVPNPVALPTLDWTQTNAAGGQLTIGFDPGNGFGRAIGTLDLSGTYVQSQFSALAFGGSGTLGDPGYVQPSVTITVAACYCRGTLIQTEMGEVAVEALAGGDVVMTASGVLRPIRWIGHREHAERFALRNRALWPVMIEAGALAHDVPRRDLFVSPSHAMYLDNVLIPALALVNGTTIRQVQPHGAVTYFHVELDDHDIIVAEGSLSESYVDDDNRGMFANAATYPGKDGGPAIYCAPRLQQGSQVEAVRRGIAERARLAA